MWKTFQIGIVGIGLVQLWMMWRLRATSSVFEQFAERGVCPKQKTPQFHACSEISARKGSPDPVIRQPDRPIRLERATVQPIIGAPEQAASPLDGLDEADMNR